jgi:hypothetical protein
MIATYFSIRWTQIVPSCSLTMTIGDFILPKVICRVERFVSWNIGNKCYKVASLSAYLLTYSVASVPNLPSLRNMRMHSTGEAHVT